MSLTSARQASEPVSALLCGTQLDTIRVYSLIVQLGFIRVGAADLPQEVWVVVSGDLLVDGPTSAAADTSVASEFFSRRALALRENYFLIGRRVTAAWVSDSGELEIELGDTRLRAKRDEHGDLEEVWAVMSETPDANLEHRWYVSLDDSGALSVCVPSG